MRILVSGCCYVGAVLLHATGDAQQVNFAIPFHILCRLHGVKHIRSYIL